MAATGSPGLEVQRIARRLQSAMGADAVGGILLDPTTLEPCGGGGAPRRNPRSGPLPASAATWSTTGSLDDPRDFNPLTPTELVACRGRGRSLAQARHGQPQRSERWVQALSAVGVTGQLSVVLSDRAGAWAMVSLFRWTRGFTAAEVRACTTLASRMTADVVVAMRDGPLAAHRRWTEGPLMIAWQADGDVASTPATRAPSSNGLHGSAFESWVEALQLRVDAQGLADGLFVDGPAMVHGQLTRTGRYFNLLVRGANASQLAELVMLANGLTTRERAVTTLVCRGRTNRQIAFELDSADGTVVVHLRSVMKKLGLKSRAAVVARLHAF